MNLSIITVQIVSRPKLINTNKKKIVYMRVVIPNEKKNTKFYTIYAYINNHRFDNICELYQIKDIVILVGYLYMRKYCKNVVKTYNYMIMKVDDIQPYIRYIK